MSLCDAFLPPVRRRGVKSYAPTHHSCSHGFALLFVHRNFLTDLVGVGDAFGMGLGLPFT